MLAAYHFQLSDQAIRDLYDEQPSDIFVRDMYSHLGWDWPGMRDGRLFEWYEAPGSKIELPFFARAIRDECNVLSSSADLQRSTQSLCDAVANPALGSLCQDIEDTLDFDHCDDSLRAQCSHFMRPTSAETDESYYYALGWIASNVQSAASNMSALLDARVAQLSAPSLFPRMFARVGKGLGIAPQVTNGFPSKYLGRALHALQDSFAEGHTLRDWSQAGRTGPILHLFSYKQQDHAEHDRFDRTVATKGGVRVNRFTDFGKIVIEASKDLIWLTTQLAHAHAPPLDSLPTWKAFVNRWLTLSPDWRRYSDAQSLA